VLQYIQLFCQSEDGQDLVEYSLLMCFIGIVCMMLIGSGRPAVNSIWTSANSRMVQANTIANGGSAP
jgi:Flp pilus assembly pilin Flp